MDRFIAFAGDSFYAVGGALDFKGSAPTQAEAEAIVKNAKSGWDESAPCDWWHVFDMETKRIVAGKSGGYCGRIRDQK